jgi:hypothetical protein
LYDPPNLELTGPDEETLSCNVEDETTMQCDLGELGGETITDELTKQ